MVIAVIAVVAKVRYEMSVEAFVGTFVKVSVEGMYELVQC